MTRRELLACAGGLAAVRTLRAAPSSPVAIGRARTYGPELVPVMDKLFDGLGGLGRLVKGKTVAIKLNLTGVAETRFGCLNNGITYWTHPDVISATIHLMEKAGARRIRLLESAYSTGDPLHEFLYKANWDPSWFTSAAKNVEFENTNLLGSGREYVRFKVPGGGLLFDAYDMNHSYEKCDVFVSLAKLKEHATAGITLSIKNCFGNTPCTIYGDHAGIDAPSLAPRGGRGTIFHYGKRGPSKSSPQEKDPKSPRDDGYRIPRIIADLVAARPVDLAIIEGVETISGAEGPWVAGTRHVKPGVIVAGTNPVCTDAVATAVMGFDPMADRGKAPFEACDNTMRLAEELGVGTRDLSRIDVAGMKIEDARFVFRKPGEPPAWLNRRRRG